MCLVLSSSEEAVVAYMGYKGGLIGKQFLLVCVCV